MNQTDAEIESAHFTQGIARAWLRRDRLKRWSYRLGYLTGRMALYWKFICRIFGKREIGTDAVSPSAGPDTSANG